MLKLLKENFRILMDGNRIPVLVDINIDQHYIIAEMIAYFFRKECMVVESVAEIQEMLKDILFIWDGNTTAFQDLTFEHFSFCEDYHKLFPFPHQESDSFPTVDVFSANVFYDIYNRKDDLLEFFQKDHRIVVIGPLNRIAPNLFQTIWDCFPISTLVLFGDDKLDSPENYNYHSRYLSNSNMQLAIPYHSGRITNEKKVNSILDKLRKSNVKLSDLSTTIVNMIESPEDIDTSIIETYLQDLNTLVIVPDRLIDSVNSILWEKKYGSDLTLQPGMYLQTTHPFKVEQESNDRYIEFVIPAYTTIFISRILKKIIAKNQMIYLMDIQVEVDGDLLIIHNVEFDYADFLSQFHAPYHPENMEDFKLVHYGEVLNRMNLWNPTILKCSPFPITIMTQAKYCIRDTVVVFMEMIDSWMLEKHPTDFYGYLSGMLKNAVIYKANEFREVY